ncbi:MAG TPA: DNA modification methylase, partial [Spirochaetia bacterium]|nr:DNA modification methylase [Spirochaetia bacterium]
CEQLNRVCYMMELDPKYASVILRRYVEDTDDAENVYVIRNGERIDYSALVKQVDFETV